MGCEILRRGSIGFGLALVTGLGVLVFYGNGRNVVVVFLEMFALGCLRYLLRSVMLIRVLSLVLVEFLVVHFFMVFAGARQGFTWKQFDRSNIHGRHGWR